MNPILINNFINFATKTADVKETLNVSEMTKGEILIEGAFDTIIGMSITFAVLIAIAFIIWMFKFIAVFEASRAEKKNSIVNNTANVQTLIEKSNVKVEQVGIDDMELVTVISAAIAASLNTSTDNLVVRSIRKVRA
jgi:sodium pump decarboxylase gamma subunit